MTFKDAALDFAGRVLGRRSDRLDAAVSPPPVPDDLPREDAEFALIWEKCRPYTMTSFARGLALFRAIRHLVQNDIAGDVVECGVWRGGSSMIAMATLLSLNAADRRIIMLDTYAGMTEPGEADTDREGTSARDLLESEEGKVDGVLCYASLDEVRRNVAAVGYPLELITFVKGDIRQTAATVAPSPISLLRLDTDFYDSTKIELEVFYPRLVDKGVLIIDDYGHWQGARRAVDEYFDGLRHAGTYAPLLHIIDYTGRSAVK